MTNLLTASESQPIEARRPLPAWLFSAGVVGFLFGVLAKAGDNWGERWATDLGTYPALWILVIVLLGLLASTVVDAAIGAVAFFVPMVLAYYGWSIPVLGYDMTPYAFAWGLLAVTLCPALAALSWLAIRRRGVLAGLVLGLMAGAILGEGPIRQFWLLINGGLPADFPMHPVQAIVDVAFATLIIFVVPRTRSARLWAFGFAILVAFAEPMLTGAGI